MAISANRLVYDFERKLDTINSGRINQYRVVDVVSFLREAWEIVYEAKVNSPDLNDKRRNDLRQLLVKRKELPVEEVDKDTTKGIYPEDFYKRENQVAIVCNDCCKDPKELIVRIPQNDDLQEARRNPYRQSNFFYEQLLGSDGEDGLYIHHDCAMEVKNIYIDYYRKPTFPEAPNLVECEDNSYRNYDNKLITQRVDFEIDSTYIAREVVDVAVLLATIPSNDPKKFSEQLQLILQTNQLYKS